jgi:hypothetical protein
VCVSHPGDAHPHIDSVSDDCTGTATYPDGQKTTSFISPDGSRFMDTITTASGSQVVATSRALRQQPGQGLTCAEAWSIQG